MDGAEPQGSHDLDDDDGRDEANCTAVTRLAPPDSDVSSTEFAGDVCILDSLPPIQETQKLAESLGNYGYRVKRRHCEEQSNVSDCGYRAIKDVHEFCVPNRFLGSVWKPDPVIRFFNSVIEIDPRSEPIRLSDDSIRTIVKCMEFLYHNFHLHPWNFTEANILIDLLRKIRDALREAVRDTESYSQPWPLTEHLILNLLDMLKEKTREGKFKTTLKNMCTMMKINRPDLDYLEIAAEFNNMFSSLELPDWFDGVFSFEEFVMYMANIRKSTLSRRDRPLSRIRSAIVNTHERPGKHWLAASFQLPGDQEKLSVFGEATHGCRRRRPIGHF